MEAQNEVIFKGYISSLRFEWNLPDESMALKNVVKLMQEAKQVYVAIFAENFLIMYDIIYTKKVRKKKLRIMLKLKFDATVLVLISASFFSSGTQVEN